MANSWSVMFAFKTVKHEFDKEAKLPNAIWVLPTCNLRNRVNFPFLIDRINGLWALRFTYKLSLLSWIQINLFSVSFNILAGITHRMSCTSKLRIPICQHSTSTRSSIQSPTVTESNRWTRCQKMTRSLFFRMTFSRFCKTLRCTLTTPPTELHFCGRRVPSTWDREDVDARLIFRSSKLGIRSTARQAIRWKCAWAIRNFWNTTFWTRWSTAAQNRRRSATCSDLSSRRSSSKRRLSIGLKRDCRSAAKATTCWTCWFIARIWTTCISITTSTWSPSKLWPPRSERSHVSEMVSSVRLGVESTFEMILKS